jgi:D-ala-D-ala dipeptidase
MHSCTLLFLLSLLPVIASSSAECESALTSYSVGADVTGTLPPGFVDASEVVPNLVLDMRYASMHNFVGTVIPGYDAPKCILTSEAATALAAVQSRLLARSPPLSLKVYDCYRPQYSVDYFVQWSQNLTALQMKVCSRVFSCVVVLVCLPICFVYLRACLFVRLLSVCLSVCLCECVWVCFGGGADVCFHSYP